MFCRSCGKQLDDNAKFCKYCGAKLTASISNQSQEEEATVILPKSQAQSTPKMPSPPPSVKMPPPSEAVKMPNSSSSKTKMPMMQSAPSVSKKKKSNGSTVIIIEIIIVVILLIAIGIGAFFFLKDGKLKDMGSKKGNENSEKNIETDDEMEDDSDSLGYEEALENEEFEDVILTILDLDEDVVNEHKDEVKEAFNKALDGHLQSVFADVDGLINKNEFVDAYDALDDELSYREEIEKKYAKSNLPSDISFDTDTIESKREDVNDKYKTYVINEADAVSDVADAQALFREADKYISGESYEAEKTKVYTHIVLAKLGSMQQKGEDTTTAKAYIVSNLSLVENNCWVLEFWDYFNAIDVIKGNYTVPDGKVNHITSSGYILPDSSSRELSEYDLSGFSKMECRLARFEIYARHGRGFNDAAVTKFFSNYTWYHEQISYDKFDESVLSEVEKKNIDVIVQYERQQGYL